MKRIYYLLATVLLVSLGSCKKYLETKPTDFLNPSNYYETPAQLEFARSSAYNMLGASQLWGAWGLYLFSWSADAGYMNRSSLTAGPWNYNYGSADTYTLGLWSNLFNGINRANVVLDNVDKNQEIEQEYRDKIRGEMLFLRGYYYFILVQNFGGVPLKLNATSSVIDVDIPRNSVKEVYDQIIKDMETAEALVPGIVAIGNAGEISKSAVRGLLARVNLHMAGAPLNDATRYAEASKWAKMVIDDTEAGHALNSSYPDIFKTLAQDRYDLKESIWEVEFWGNRQDQFTETGYTGWINGPAVGANNKNTGRADAYMNITSKFYDAFEPGDNRKWYSIAHFSFSNALLPSGQKNMVSLPTSQNAKNLMKPGKWRREYETTLPKFDRGTPINFPLLRYTDVLLMYAEAENEINNGPTQAAIRYVNDVRQRGWSTGVHTITVTNGGSGYTGAPTVTFSEGIGGNTATGKATIVNGQVTAITLDRDLTGVTYYKEGDYSAPPTVTISGGGGSGAAATTAIYRKTDANLTSAQTSSKAAFLAVIQDERFREFNFEYLRKGDLLRWGTFLEVNQDLGNRLQQESPGAYFVKYYSNVTPRDLLMPIPNNEVTTNLAIVQNPGWN
ncbi:MAG TPA: RagB/SusD family nutrient uptake outer membrane protein [Sphingobacteriaceae bacterium]